VLLAVMLGLHESHEDRLALGRDLIARGPGRAAADRRRRRARADQDRRAVLARLRSPALRRASRAQPAGQAARSRARTSAPGLLAGARRRHRRARRKATTPGPGRGPRQGRIHRRRQVPRRRPRRPRRAPALPDTAPPQVAQHQPARTKRRHPVVRRVSVGTTGGRHPTRCALPHRGKRGNAPQVRQTTAAPAEFHGQERSADRCRVSAFPGAGHRVGLGTEVREKSPSARW
jgi:hypothetical protein